jgi:hypothetical protein
MSVWDARHTQFAVNIIMRGGVLGTHHVTLVIQDDLLTPVTPAGRPKGDTE